MTSPARSFLDTRSYTTIERAWFDCLCRPEVFSRQSHMISITSETPINPEANNLRSSYFSNPWLKKSHITLLLKYFCNKWKSICIVFQSILEASSLYWWNDYKNYHNARRLVVEMWRTLVMSFLNLIILSLCWLKTELTALVLRRKRMWPRYLWGLTSSKRRVFIF